MADGSRKPSFASGSVYNSTNDLEMKDFSSVKEISDSVDDSVKGHTSLTKQDSSQYENNSIKQDESFLTTKDDSFGNKDENNQSESDNEENKLRKPLLSNQTEETEMVRIPAIKPDAALSNDEVERTSLLENETNLDEIQPVNESESLKNETHRSKRVFFKRNPQYFVLGVLALLMFAFFIFILPGCIFYLNYDEFALVQSKLTGKVDDSKTYGPGFYIMSPFSQWIKFQKTAHMLKLNDLIILTTDKLQVKISLTLFYFLDKNGIGKLFRKFGSQSYQKLVNSVSRSELLYLGQSFSIDEYRTQRIKVKKFFEKKLTERLLNDYFIKVHGLYLENLNFPKEINDLNLLRMINGVENEKALYLKTHAMILQETKYRVNTYKNEALVAKKRAELIGNNTIIKIENTFYNYKLEVAHLQGLNSTLRGLGFYSERVPRNSKKILSYCWVSSLVNNENLRILSPDKLAKPIDSQINPFIGLINL